MMLQTSTGRVLVVDDNRMSRELLFGLIQQQGYEPIITSSGAEALEVIAREPLDVVLLDIMMPHMSGFQVLEHLVSKSITPAVPVVVVSALTERESRIKALKMGATDFVTKPIDIDEFSVRLRSVIGVKKLHDQLAIREGNLRAILEGAVDGIITIDESGQIDEFNPGAERLFGYAHAEVVGQNVRLLMPSPYHEEDDGNLERCLRTGERRIIGIGREVVGRRKDGSTFPMWLTVSEAKTPGRHFFVGIAQDITQRKAIEDQLVSAKEEAEKANRAKSEFLAAMSHELRTPLNGILGMNELLLNTELTERQRQFVEAASASGKALLQQVNDILDLSKIEAGKLELDLHECRLEALVFDVADVFVHAAQKKGYPLHCQFDPAACVNALCDGNRIRQILVNLLGNALKFTNAGAITLNTQCTSWIDDQLTVRFSVTDSGVGIPEDRRDRLFAPFSQVDRSTSRHFGGTGLGLSICKQLVELMGGQIGFESQVGVGTTFWFEIPMRIIPEDSAVDKRRDMLVGQRVLLVDLPDKRHVQVLECLHSWGSQSEQVATLQDGLEAITRAKAVGKPFAAVIADCRLVAGDEYIRLNQLAEDFGIPVIGFGAAPDDDTVSHLRELGVRHILREPIRPSTLFNTLTTVLAIKSPGVIPNQSSDAVTDQQPSMLSGHILVAEDNNINQMFVHELLKHCGCTCDLANNGDAALTALRQNRYDLVLMDCQMPEMDGFTATREIRRREAAGELTSRLPIIALTANALKGDREHCLAAGMDDYLSKPLQAAHLQTMLAKFLAPQCAEQTPSSSLRVTYPRGDLRF